MTTTFYSMGEEEKKNNLMNNLSIVDETGRTSFP